MDKETLKEAIRLSSIRDKLKKDLRDMDDSVNGKAYCISIHAYRNHEREYVDKIRSYIEMDIKAKIEAINLKIDAL